MWGPRTRPPARRRIRAGIGIGFGGRGSGHRKAQLATSGGVKHSERAITGALIWLAKHQRGDGSWSFAPSAQAAGAYTNPGTWKSDSAATALALLPFLGAGTDTQEQGTLPKNRRRRPQLADQASECKGRPLRRWTAENALACLGDRCAGGSLRVVRR